MMMPHPQTPSQQLKEHLLGRSGAKAVRVESQWVFKVDVHPSHDIGAELQGKGAGVSGSQDVPCTSQPTAAPQGDIEHSTFLLLDRYDIPQPPWKTSMRKRGDTDKSTAITTCWCAMPSSAYHSPVAATVTPVLQMRQ